MYSTMVVDCATKFCFFKPKTQMIFLDRKKDGTGRKLLDHKDGKVSVWSGEGVGTSF
jgi:hypothetical protein